MSAARHEVIPTSVTNRRLVNQLKLWGYQEDRTRGDLVLMVGPEGETLEVMREHIHQGNDKTRLSKVYKTVCGGDAVQFWSRSERLVAAVAYRNDKPLAQKISVPKLAVVPDEPRPRVTEMAGDRPQIEKLEELMNTPPDKARTAARLGLANEVLDYMQKNPSHTFSNVAIMEALNCRRDQANNTLNHLAERGFLVRVMRGSFKLSPTFRAESVVHHQHTGPVDMVARSAAPDVPSVAPTLPQDVRSDVDAAERPAPIASPVLGRVIDAPRDNVAADEDDLDALLELVLPSGYEFHPSHLRAMRRWQVETAKLLAVLKGE